MAGITLAQAQAQLDAALSALTAAKTALASGKKKVVYQGREIDAHDINLDALNRDVEFWDQKVKKLDSEASTGSTTGRVRYL